MVARPGEIGSPKRMSTNGKDDTNSVPFLRDLGSVLGLRAAASAVPRNIRRSPTTENSPSPPRSLEMAPM